MGNLHQIVEAIRAESSGVQARLLVARVGLKARVNLVKVTPATPNNPELEARLLKIAQEQGTRIFQVIISPCCFDETEQLSQFQAVNSPSKTLIEMDRGNQERLLLQLAKDIIQYSKNG